MQHPNSINDPQFFTAGKATFTVNNGKEGTGHKWYTFKIKKRILSGNALYFAFLLTSPDSYTYLGQINPSLLCCYPTKASSLLLASAPFKAINWALQLVKQGKTPPGSALIIHEGRCARCGRKLTVPASITAGFGPECAEKLGIPYEKYANSRKNSK